MRKPILSPRHTAAVSKAEVLKVTRRMTPEECQGLSRLSQSWNGDSWRS